MKNYSSYLKQDTPVRFGITVVILLMSIIQTYSQEYTSLSGYLADNTSKEAIPYANTALFKLPDSVLFRGQISDTTGHFVFDQLPAGNYLLIVSMIGYDTFLKEVSLSLDMPYQTGKIFLIGKTTNIREAFVTADRLKGRSEKDKTLYYVTKRMSEVSSNGLDIVKHIPGVQVDFRRNVSLEGSQNILILVDGIERDNNYLSQICSECIEKVEVTNTPGSRYDGNITGAINIVLRKEKKLGISGQTNVEIPLNFSEYFNHPDYNLHFGFRKLNLFTSYNGEMISLDQQESLEQKFSLSGSNVETRSDQHVIQKLWSHRIHYGFDYPLSSKSKVNFYGFYNPYSQKYSGYMDAFSINNNEVWHGDMVNEHQNKSYYYSMFFKHQFNEKGTDLSIDLNSYHFTGENKAVYNPAITETELSPIINKSRPGLKSLSAKIDLNTVISPKVKLSAGTRWRSQIMKEMKVKDFLYSETVYALYGSMEINTSLYNFNFGLRAEKSVSVLEDVFNNTKTLLLPYAMLSFKISPDKTLKAGISKSISRPNLYQLNPAVSQDDPNNVRHGNPYLDPEIRTAYFLEYSKKYTTNYFSSRIFYNHSTSVISGISFINDTAMIETIYENSGTIDQAGVQFSGTYKLGSSLNIVPYLKLYYNTCSGNGLAREYYLNTNQQIIFEPGISSIISFKHDINISMNLQYASPKNHIQSKSFSDAFYSITVEKIFLKKLTAGIVSALPFTKNFTYQGSEIKSSEFFSKYTGNINLSKPLFWIKLNYQFNVGRNIQKKSRTADEGEILPNKAP